MKKVFLALVLLFCGGIIFLASVDLTPYLTDRNDTDSSEATVDPTLEHGVPANDTISISDSMPPVRIIPQTETVVPAKKTEPAAETMPPPQSPTMRDTPAIAAQEETSARPLLARECLVLSPGSYPYSILLETFDALATARNGVTIYHEKGIDSYWVKVDLGNRGIKYRLFSGIFATPSAAREFARQHGLVNKPVKKTRFSSLLASSKDPELIRTLRQKIPVDRATSTTLCTENGDHFLYSGAFYTEAGAKQQCEELQRYGLPCSPQRRVVH